MNTEKEINNSPSTIRMPIIISLALAGGILIGANFFGTSGRNDVGKGFAKYKEVLQLVDNNYVDTVNTDELVDYSITKMLEKLDPHTTYFPLKEADAARSQLANGYDGIGVEFNLYKDTVQVVSAISGGPSEAAGVLSGDKIIRVNGEDFTGKKMDNGYIFSKLRGPRGSEVKIEVLRKNASKLIAFSFKRDRIPTFSIDATYLINNEIGYIKVTRFAESTFEEFKNALVSLKKQGMKKLIVDLRGNPGGYMDRATNMVDQLLSGDKMIVYTKGKDIRYNRETRAGIDGNFEDGGVIVLIDEGSASASEIMAGALQDHDRALIVGRRSFGKGLVQMPVNLADGSELRLTISRYYTPSGRSIQKPYEHGNMEGYESDLKKRVDGGELFNADSIKNNLKLKYKTDAGRIVYGGGGITPDVFVGRDTSMMTNYLYQLFGASILREYALQYVSKNKAELEKMTFQTYVKTFTVSEADMQNILAEAASAKVVYNDKEYKRSKGYIQSLVKSYIARYAFQKKNNDGLNNEYYQIMSTYDNVLAKALTLFDKAQALGKK